MKKKTTFYSLMIIFSISVFFIWSCEKEEIEEEKRLEVRLRVDGGGRPAPAPVGFAYTNTGGAPIKSVHWELGDGNESVGSSLMHTYEEPGSYDVILTIYGEDGEKITRSTTVSLMGELQGWYINWIMARPMAFSDVWADEFVYLYLRDHNENPVFYAGDNLVVGYTITEDWNDDTNVYWHLTDYESHPILIDFNKDFWFQIYSKHPDDPHHDTEVDIEFYSELLNSKDFLPKDDRSPYPIVIHSEFFEVGVGYQEK